VCYPYLHTIPTDFFLWDYDKALVDTPPLPRDLDERKYQIREASESSEQETISKVRDEFVQFVHSECSGVQTTFVVTLYLWCVNEPVSRNRGVYITTESDI
jgi:hypothetical protein